MEPYCFDQATWTEDLKIITDETLIVPGMEMFGNNCTSGNLYILPPHRHRSTEFLYIANGSQKYYINDKEYTLNGNQVLVVDPHVPHSTGSNPYGRHESLWFRLDLKEFTRNLGVSQDVKQLICNRLHHLDTPLISLKEHMYSDLQEAFFGLASQDPTEQLCGYAKFIGFMTQLVRCTDPSVNYSREIQQVVDYIGAHICTQLSLEDLAELAGLSLSGFKQKFRRETGISPREYINLLKVEKAKQLLSAGHSITDTAFALDFSSSSYFSVLFHQIENMSPSEYVMKLRQNI